eukprot:1923559-Amphidinium_carterae.1
MVCQTLRHATSSRGSWEQNLLTSPWKLHRWFTWPDVDQRSREVQEDLDEAWQVRYAVHNITNRIYVQSLIRNHTALVSNQCLKDLRLGTDVTHLVKHEELSTVKTEEARTQESVQA